MFSLYRQSISDNIEDFLCEVPGYYELLDNKYIYSRESSLKVHFVYSLNLNYNNSFINESLLENPYILDDIVFNEYSSSIILDSSKFEYILYLVLLSEKWGFFSYRIRSNRKYYNTLKIVSIVYLDNFFFWKASKLFSHYYSFQMYKIKFRKFQVYWFSILSSLLNILISESGNKSFSNLKVSTLTGLIISHKGRAYNYKWCKFSKELSVGYYPIKSKSTNKKRAHYNIERESFITKWGVNTMSTLLRYRYY